MTRAGEVRALGASLVDAGGVAPARMSALAWYGLDTKAPTRQDPGRAMLREPGADAGGMSCPIGKIKLQGGIATGCDSADLR